MGRLAGRSVARNVVVTGALIALVAGADASFASSAPAAAPARPSQRAHIDVDDSVGTPSAFVVRGRVLQDAAPALPSSKQGRVDNLVQTLRDLESDELPHAGLVVHVGALSFAATTDAEGVFQVAVRGLPVHEQLGLGVVVVEVELSTPGFHAAPAQAWLQVVEGDGIALVSDIDDTVVKTNVVDKVQLAQNVFLKNARQQDAVIGAADNYLAAQKAGVVAFFYLSGSPQNLFRKLRTFLEHHEFPRGPLLLKNLGQDDLFHQEAYKLERLENLAATYPRLRFVLVGDSGERDPEVYRAFLQKHPERVVAVVIRKVPGTVHLDEARFAGFTVVDDVFPHAQVIAQLVEGAANPVSADHPSSSSSSSSKQSLPGESSTTPKAGPPPPSPPQR
jgi:phosphatidate phosphatase APP1